MNTTLWRHNHADDSLSQLAIDVPLWIKADEPPIDAPATDGPLDDALMLSAVAPFGDVVAVALIPESLDCLVKHNCLPANSGMLTLRHADRLDIATQVTHSTQSFWIAVGCEVELTEYKPGEHCADAYCFLTKARLREGERIAICPGTAERSCGTIYKLSAWEAMLTQPDFRCANCTFDPKQPAWRPQLQPPVKRLDTIFAALLGGA